MDPCKHSVRNDRIWYYRAGPFLFGFTTRGITLRDLMAFTGTRVLKELKQIHSHRILRSSQIHSNTEGDGIILEESGILSIIRTADCLPLFFWNTAQKTGGILHIGWRGAAQDIELRLLEILKSRGIPPVTLEFLMGPSICGRCFEVGPEISGEFSNQALVSRIFSRHTRPGKYRLDLQKKVRLTLQENGVPEGAIRTSGICTFCNPRFHSHRRNPTAKGRILNFMIRQ